MSKKIPLVLLVIISSHIYVRAQINKEIKKLAHEDSARLTEIFKDLHQNPELAFMEVRTSGIIAKELKNLGYEVISGIGKTGVVGILNNGDGPVVMYRADMDCNSVKEVTGLTYASNKTMKKEDGTETPVMHACSRYVDVGNCQNNGLIKKPVERNLGLRCTTCRRNTCRCSSDG
jgi:hippurate hydrolase